jgi:hypothetical protein
LSRDVDLQIKCVRCHECWSALYDSDDAGGPWRLCLRCDNIADDERCSCGGPTRLCDARRCPHCRGRVIVDEYLLPPV